MLTAERLRDLLDYDPETGVFLWKKDGRGRTMRVGSVAGTMHSTGYTQINFGGEMWLAHRLAWLHVFGEWPREQIDHINGNRADNRIINLREATLSQNAANRKCRDDNASGFKGVSLNKSLGKWNAGIKVNGNMIRLGVFETPEQAHAAYCAAADKLHGEFARVA
jgi:hypothetical protein